MEEQHGAPSADEFATRHGLFDTALSGAAALAAGGLGRALDGARKASRIGIAVFGELEMQTLRLLQQRLDAAAGRDGAARTAVREGDDLASGMRRLLASALEQTQEQAWERWCQSVQTQLLPDEARILSVLADGRVIALSHLGSGSLVGPATRRHLENLSTIGREAGLRLVDQAPHYLRHLRQLGLVETGPEDRGLQLQYQLIESEARVRELGEQISSGGQRPRFARHTLRLSELGQRFWAACQPPVAEVSE